MRRMLNEAEAEKRLAYERSEHMIRLRNANSGQEMRSQMDKIADMEREHHRLQASQAVAQVGFTVLITLAVSVNLLCQQCFGILDIAIWPIYQFCQKPGQG